ncbi:hypothetical protein Leryth_021169 [Lithospermum erythrorhizon]|nr:hypothetical protein Leryth_021169 [Lithospermum erythrorhizon]
MGVDEKFNSIHEKPENRIEIDKQFLSAPVKKAVDKFQLVPEYLKARGLARQHLDSFNYFVGTEIKKIVEANNTIKSSQNENIWLKYTNVRIDEPSTVINAVTVPITPHNCRLSDLTYSAPIKVDVVYCNGTGYINQAKSNVTIGRMPIMLRSSHCVLYGKDEEELAKLGSLFNKMDYHFYRFCFCLGLVPFSE